MKNVDLFESFKEETLKKGKFSVFEKQDLNVDDIFQFFWRVKPNDTLGYMSDYYICTQVDVEEYTGGVYTYHFKKVNIEFDVKEAFNLLTDTLCHWKVDYKLQPIQLRIIQKVWSADELFNKMKMDSVCMNCKHLEGLVDKEFYCNYFESCNENYFKDDECEGFEDKQ